MQALRSWNTDHGEAPSIRELGRMVGLSSTGSVAYLLGRLERARADQPHQPTLAFRPARQLTGEVTNQAQPRR
ncbi:LexA family protein [Streptomyces sp. NPDC054841]